MEMKAADGGERVRLLIRHIPTEDYCPLQLSLVHGREHRNASHRRASRWQRPDPHVFDGQVLHPHLQERV
jgi:hypothetical protein